MSKAELEKEAEEKAKKRTKGFKCQDNCEKSYVMGFLDCSRLREKRIADLEAENEQIKNSDTLCKLIGEQKRKITDLEAQIEKMKNCGNCEHFNFNEPNYCHKGVYRERQYVCSEWEFGN